MGGFAPKPPGFIAEAAVLVDARCDSRSESWDATGNTAQDCGSSFNSSHGARRTAVKRCRMVTARQDLSRNERRRHDRAGQRIGFARGVSAFRVAPKVAMQVRLS